MDFISQSMASMYTTTGLGENAQTDYTLQRRINQKNGRTTQTSWRPISLNTDVFEPVKNPIWLQCDHILPLKRIPVSAATLSRARAIRDMPPQSKERDDEIQACRKIVQLWLRADMIYFLGQDDGVDEMFEELADATCTLCVCT